jgi:predicted ATP-grasp superfamily ATP-dependent carboligase
MLSIVRRQRRSGPLNVPTNSQVPAYVLWFGATGLTIARSLGRRGIPVVAVHDVDREPCLLSRYVRPVVLPPVYKDEKAWIDFLVDEGRRLAPRKAVIFAAADEHWLLMVRHREVLAEYFHFPLPWNGPLERWPTKSFQYEEAERLGIPYPRTARPRTVDELRSAALSFEFPCLVKPTLSARWIRQYGEKLAFVRSAEALLARGADALERGIEFVVQEYIPGPDNNVFNCEFYLDRKSEVLAGMVRRKMRQFAPRFGSSCLSMSIDDPEVAELGLRMLKPMGYHGIGGVEFKRDARTGQLKLIEINVRTGLMGAVAVNSGVDLPCVAYCDLLGLPAPRLRVRLGKRAGLLVHDIYCYKFYRRVGQLSTWRWVLSWMRTRDIHFAWDDLRPFLRYASSIFHRWREGRYRQLPENFPTVEEWRAGEWPPPQEVALADTDAGALVVPTGT